MAKRFTKADIQRNKDGGYRREGLLLLLSGKSLVWWVHEWVKLVTGERKHCRQTTGFGEADYERAQLARNQILNDFREGKEKRVQCPTFTEWVKIYQKLYEKHGKKGKLLAAGTLVTHASRLVPLLAFFGALALDKLTPAKCREYYNTRKSVISENSTKGECQLMAAILEVAILNTDHIAKNPWKQTGLDLAIGKRLSGRSVGLEEEDIFLSMSTPEMQRFYTIMLWTGFRSGAMLQLEVNKLISIDGSFGVRVRSKGKEYPQPLEGDSYKAYVTQSAYVLANNPNETRLFPFSYAALLIRMAKARTDGGLAHFIPHDVRRTLTTRLRGSGEATKGLSELLHHSDDGTLVEEHYLTDNVQEVEEFKANRATLQRGAAAIRGV